MDEELRLLREEEMDEEARMEELERIERIRDALREDGISV